MKYLFYTIVFLLLLLKVNGQDFHSIQKYTSLPSKLLINYSLHLKPNNEIISDTLNMSYLKTFPIINVDSVISNSISSVPIFYNSGDIIDQAVNEKQQIKQKSIIKKYLGYNPFKRNIIQNVKSYGFNFYEEWVFSENPFVISKKVIGYSPIPNDYKFIPKFIILDTLSNDREITLSNDRMILFNKVEYEYFSDSVFITNSQIINNKVCSNKKESSLFKITPLIEFILLYIQYGGLEAYNNNNQLLYYDQVLTQLEVERDTTTSFVDYTYTVSVVVGDVDYDKIKSILYEEEWYIDPITLRITKNILAVSPVIYTYDDKSKKTIRKVPFKVFLKPN